MVQFFKPVTSVSAPRVGGLNQGRRVVESLSRKGKLDALSPTGFRHLYREATLRSPILFIRNPHID